MFQATVNENVYRSLYQRLSGIERNLESAINFNELSRVCRLLGAIRSNIESLQPALLPNSSQRISEFLERLERDAAERNERISEAQANATRVNDNNANPPTGASFPAAAIGRPKKDVDKGRLNQLLGMGFTVTEIARKNLLGVKVHRNTINNVMKKERIITPSKAKIF